MIESYKLLINHFSLSVIIWIICGLSFQGHFLKTMTS